MNLKAAPLLAEGGRGCACWQCGYGVPAPFDRCVTACYKVFATNEIEAKQILLEEAGYSIKAEILYDSRELEAAEVIEVAPSKKEKVA